MTPEALDYLQYGALGLLTLVLIGAGTGVGVAIRAFIQEFKRTNEFMRNQMHSSNQAVVQSNQNVTAALNSLNTTIKQVNETVEATCETMSKVSGHLDRHDDRTTQAHQHIFAGISRVEGAIGNKKV
jgi:hypothetical protein